MSEFFKALEQAERDRALGRPPRPPEVEPGEAAPRASVDPMVESPAVATAVVEEPAPSRVFRPPIAKRISRPEVRPDAGEAPGGVDGHMVSLVTPNTFEAEQYRTLRHMIEQLHTSAGVSIIACTSPAGGDGKTTTAINLAGALAQAPDAKVLLVDADFRRPCIARELTLSDDAGPGLVGAIVNRNLTLEDVVRRRPPFALSILPAGSAVANPYELLKSPRLGELMEEARRRYDYVVLDTPPVVAIPDCRAIARCVDGFVVIVAAHRTPRKLLEETLNSMEPAKVIGLIFNGDDRPLSGYYYGGKS
jgi:protein-tyrosine kinase